MKTIKDIMHKKPVSLDENLSIHDAAVQMSKHEDYDAFPVMEKGQIVGILSVHDVLTRVIAKNKNPESTSVKDVMTKKAQVCHENDSLEDVVNKMVQHDINGMPVLNEKNQLSGFVSMDDFVHKADNEKLTNKLVKALQKSA